MSLRNSLRLLTLQMVALVYVLTALLTAYIEPTFPNTLWPASGVALAGVLLLGYRVWWAILLGAVLATLSTDPAWLEAGIITLAHTVEPLLAAWLLQRLGYRTDQPETLPSVTLFVILGVIIGPMASTIIVVKGLAAAQLLGATTEAQLALSWWLGHALGVLLVTPLLMVIKWARHHQLLQFNTGPAPATPTAPSTPAEPNDADLLYINSLEGMALADPKGFIKSTNPAFETLTGLRPNQAHGIHLRELCYSDATEGDTPVDLWSQLTNSGSWQGEVRKTVSGTQGNYHAWLSANKVDGDQQQGYVLVLHDISERKRKDERMQFLAHHDTLTGLPNRALFQDRLERAIAHAKRRQGTVALLYLDLDNFKPVNDTLGHPAGDQVLKQVAKQLQTSVRNSDTVARVGGDEFTVIVELAEDGATAVERINKVATKILTNLSKPIQFNEHEWAIHASVGIALYPRDGCDESELVANADAAMFQAKSSGRNCIRYYAKEMDKLAHQQQQMSVQYDRALANDEFHLCYQPQYDSRTGRILGAEALLRWDSPEQGLLPAAQFISAAERSGTLEQISMWVLEQVCLQYRQWADIGLAPRRLSVNVSSVHIRQKHFPKQLLQLLHKHGVQPDFLALEIHEDAFVNSMEAISGCIQELHDLGIWVVIDNFGNGISSLHQLHQLPIDSLKLGQNIVQRIGADEAGQKMAAACMQLGLSLDLQVQAGTVETPEQIEFLRQHGCDVVQGHAFHKAMPADVFRDLLRHQSTY